MKTPKPSLKTWLNNAQILQQPTTTYKQLKNSLLDFLLPPVCLNCHQPLDLSHHLCAPCWQGLDFISKPYCQINGTPLPFDLGEGAISATAQAHPPSYGRARAVAHYNDTMRTLIHKLKYQDRHELVTLMAIWLQTAGKELIDECDLIIPIPLHKKRLWERRFNQSTLLGKKLSELSQKPIDLTILKRTKQTKSQVGLSLKARKANLAGAFKLTKQKTNTIYNKSILLIDDVITTGSTVNSAAKVLKNAGAKTVDVLSLAHVTKSTANLNEKDLFY